MSLCVMTYNILNGGENREAHILEVIKTVQPDVLILQEVFTAEFLEFISKSSGMSYHIGGGNKRRKVALLSRLPVHTFKSHHPIFCIWRNFISAEIEYESNKRMRIIGVHPIASLSVPFELLRFCEAKYILKHSQQFQDMPCLIAGDFNAIAPKDRIDFDNMPGWLKVLIYLQGRRAYHFSIQAFLSAGFTDCFRLLNSTDDGFTLPPPRPNARLDYIFVNARMKMYLTKCRVVYEPNAVNLASDHYPVTAEFNLVD